MAHTICVRLARAVAPHLVPALKMPTSVGLGSCTSSICPAAVRAFPGRQSPPPSANRNDLTKFGLKTAKCTCWRHLFGRASRILRQPALAASGVKIFGIAQFDRLAAPRAKGAQQQSPNRPRPQRHDKTALLYQWAMRRSGCLVDVWCRLQLGHTWHRLYPWRYRPIHRGQIRRGSPRRQDPHHHCPVKPQTPAHPYRTVSAWRFYRSQKKD
jgi:hypothetical protein